MCQYTSVAVHSGFVHFPELSGTLRYVCSVSQDKAATLVLSGRFVDVGPLPPIKKWTNTTDKGRKHLVGLYFSFYLCCSFGFVCSLQLVAIGYKQAAWVRGSSYIPSTASVHYICKCNKTLKWQFSLVRKKIKTLSYKWKDMHQSKTNEGRNERKVREKKNKTKPWFLCSHYNDSIDWKSNFVENISPSAGRQATKYSFHDMKCDWGRQIN